MSKWDLTGFYPSVYIHNQLPVIKPSASAARCDMIDYFSEIHLNLSRSRLVAVAKLYTQRMTAPKQITCLPRYDF